MKHRVSVIVPTYNRAAYLREAIDSVLAQTYAGFEIIVVDDGSTDETPQVLDAYADEPRLTWFGQANAGQAAARNAGLGRARSEFVCFLDSDNRWKPEKLERQLAFMDAHPEVGVVYGENELIDEDGRPAGSARMKRYSGWVTRHLLIDNFVNFNSSIVRRHLIDRIGGLDPSVRAGDDYDLWLRLSPYCQFLFVPEVWAEYRVGGTRISGNKERRFESNRRMIERFMANNPEIVGLRVKRTTWCRFYSRRGRWLASDGRHREALRDQLRALAWYPFSPAPWRALARMALGGAAGARDGRAREG